jgi:SAM-dependent methyltransferase
MGYVFDFKDAMMYERWHREPERRSEAERECHLMIEMLQPARGETVLDIGCGTGIHFETLLERGVSPTGLDPSPYMLDCCFQRFGPRVELYRAHAEDLPFDDNSFNHAVLMTTLEFVDDPRQSIAEACRVAKDRVFVGALNRYAIKSIQRRVAGMFSESIFNKAQFFGVWELKRMVLSVAGPVPIAWRTINQFPAACSGLAQNLEYSPIVQRCPFGAFLGVVATLMPRFRTRPLALRYHAKKTSGIVAPNTS